MKRSIVYSIWQDTKYEPTETRVRAEVPSTCDAHVQVATQEERGAGACA